MSTICLKKLQHKNTTENHLSSSKASQGKKLWLNKQSSMGFVHTRCLEQWLNVSSHSFCELCSYRFEVIQVRRYSLLKSIRIWVCQDRGSLYKAVFFIILSFTNSFLLSWMWFLWLSHFPISFDETKENLDHEEQEVNRPKWIAVFIFLSLLTLFSVKSLCFDGYKAVKTQYYKWHRWWNETVNVQLVLDLENYKIKNKLEESKDISLKYPQDKLSTLNENTFTNVKTAEFPDGNNYLNKFSQDIPEIHVRKFLIGKESTRLELDPEIGVVNIEPDESHDILEYNIQEKVKDCNESTTSNTSHIDMPVENDNQNINLKDIPKVHKQNTEKE